MNQTPLESWSNWLRLGINLWRTRINKQSLQALFVKFFLLGMLIQALISMAYMPNFFAPPFENVFTNANQTGWVVGTLLIIGTILAVYISRESDTDTWLQINRSITGGSGMGIGLVGGIYLLIPLLTAVIIISFFIGLYTIISMNTKTQANSTSEEEK